MPVDPGPTKLPFGGRDLGVHWGPWRNGVFGAFDLGALVRQAGALLLVAALVLVVLPAFSGSAHASGLRLYLHNVPSPPSGDTSGSSNLPMNAAAPTAGTLYSYNVDQFGGRSGRHVREGSSLGHTESNAGYMVNWVYQAPEDLALNGTATAGIWITQKDGCNLPGHFHVWLREGGSLIASGEAAVPATGGSPPCAFGFVPIAMSVSRAVPAGAWLELKVTVDTADRDAALVAYDTASYASYLDLPVTVWTPTPEPPTPTPEPPTPTPEPATPTPEPATPTPEPATPTPEPATPTPEPATPTPEPATPTPEPATPTPEPPTPTPEPPTPTPTPEPPTPPPPTPTPTPTPNPPTPPPPAPTPTPTPEPPTPPPPTKPPTPTPIEPTPTQPPTPTWFPTDPPTPTPPPPTPTPTAPPTPTPTEPPTPTPTQSPPPTPDPIPSFVPPISPHETMPPLGELETPPPPSSPPQSPPPTSPIVTPPPAPGPLAPLATPAPRLAGEDVRDTDETRDPGTQADRDDDPHRQLVDLTGGGGIDPRDPSGDGDGDGSIAATIAKLARTAGEAVKTFAFPLSLTVLVLIFLLIQGEIDRRDPKLAFAPVDSSKDMVHFE